LARDFRAIERALKTVVGENYVLSDPVDLALYECDAETLDVARPDLVVLPSNSEQVRQIVQIANKHEIPVTPRGAGTGLSGGSTTVMGGISLVLTRMTKILRIDPVEGLVVVEVGATNASISKAAKPFGLYYAPDPSSQSASTIGGNIAENAGGPHTLKYGMTIDHVLGLKVVLPDGQIIKLGSETRSHFGIDWLGLFIGSEGTLGIATEATLRLISLPQAIETMVTYFSSLEAGGNAVSKIVAAGIIPAAMEMIDNLTLNAVEDWLNLGLDRQAGAMLIVEIDGPRSGIERQKGLVEEIVFAQQAFKLNWAKDDLERKKIWQARKSAFGALGRIAPNGYVLDGVIPRSRLAEAISHISLIGQKYHLKIANIYHAGDGNLHPNILYHQDNADEVKRVLLAGREILQVCVDLGGTLSGEHGIGIEKLLYMPMIFSPEEMQAMDWVKTTFNPSSLCNPGKILPTPRTCGESGLRPLIRHNL
jgi:glycolate oxidase subunit GlcD